MNTKKRTLILTITALLIAPLLLLGGSKVASAAYLAEPSLFAPAAQAAQLPSGPIFDDRVGGEVEFTGTVEAISLEAWTISGLTVKLQPGVEIKGSPAIGDLVKVHASRDAAGQLTAREIELTSAVLATPGAGNDNGDDNSNANESGDDNSNLNGDDDNGNGDDDNGNGDDDNGNGDDDNGNGDDDNGNGDDDDDDDNSNGD
jgi:hypothetical protein